MKIKRARIAVFLLFYFLYSSSPAQNVLESYTYWEGFDSGDVSGWASYPPVRDEGYDITLRVGEEPADGIPHPLAPTAPPGERKFNCRLIRRIMPAVRTNLTMGFIRRFNMYLDDESSMSLKYYIKAYQQVTTLRITFYLADGSRLAHDIVAPKIAKWTPALFTWSDVLLQNPEYQSSDPAHVNAVTVTAHILGTDPEAIVHLSIDDIEIKGGKAPLMQIKQPEVSSLKEWDEFISSKVFHTGDQFDMKGIYSCTPQIKRVNVSFAPFTRKDSTVSETRLRFNKKSGLWENRKPFILDPNSFAPGLWVATITAIGKKKSTLSTTKCTFFIASLEKNKGHPRLLFGPEDINTLKTRIKDDLYSDIWNKMEEIAKNARMRMKPDSFKETLHLMDRLTWQTPIHLNVTELFPSLDNYANMIRFPGECVRNNAIVYALQGDKTAGWYAKDVILQVCKWNTWTSPWLWEQGIHTHPAVGEMLCDFALGYDLVHDLMSDAERKTVRDGIMEKGIIPIYKEYVIANRIFGNSSNWITRSLSGALACLLVLEDDIAEMEPYISGFLLKLNANLNNLCNGSYKTGYDSYNAAMGALGTSLPALKRLISLDLTLSVRNGFPGIEGVWDSERNRLYEFGDTGTSVKDFGNFAWIAALGPKHLKALYNMKPGNGFGDILAGIKDGGRQTYGELFRIETSRDSDRVFLRSGSTEDDLFHLIFHCGQHYDKQYRQQGAFLLADFGEDFLVGTQNSSYHNDPWYERLFIQAGGHNTILVNGDPVSQRTGDFHIPGIPALNRYGYRDSYVEGENIYYFSGKLERVYEDRLKTLTRNFIYLKDHVILLVDEAETHSGDAEVNLLFHPPYREDIQAENRIPYTPFGTKSEGAVNPDMLITDREFAISRPKGTLYMYSILPEKVSILDRHRPGAVTDFSGIPTYRVKERGYVEISGKTSSGKATFVTALITAKSDTRPDVITDSKADYTKIELPPVGIKEKMTTFYINHNKGTSYNRDRMNTDAFILGEGKQDHAITKLLFVRSTQILKDGKKVISTSVPISGYMMTTKNGVFLLNYSCPEETQLEFFSSKKPSRISFGVKDAKKVKYSKKTSTVTITLPEGNGHLRVLFD